MLATARTSEAPKTDPARSHRPSRIPILATLTIAKSIHRFLPGQVYSVAMKPTTLRGTPKDGNPFFCKALENLCNTLAAEELAGHDFAKQPPSACYSMTDADANLSRRGRGQPANLCFMGHALAENYHGPVVEGMLVRPAAQLHGYRCCAPRL